jgi:hypothetical protein
MCSQTGRDEGVFVRVNPHTRALLEQHRVCEDVGSLAELLERMAALYDHTVGGGPEPVWLAEAKRRGNN